MPEVLYRGQIGLIAKEEPALASEGRWPRICESIWADAARMARVAHVF